MEQKESTKEQLKKFWELCGFTIKEHDLPESTPYNRMTVTGLTSPDGEYIGDYVKLNLNNLFKYAVPLAVKKLAEQYGVKTFWKHSLEFNTYYAKRQLFESWLKNIKSGLSDELALYWAIWEVIK